MGLNMKARLPWKTKRMLRNMQEPFNTPARIRRYRRLNRPSLPRQLSFLKRYDGDLYGSPRQWYEIPMIDKIWRDNHERIEKRLKRMK